MSDDARTLPGASRQIIMADRKRLVTDLLSRGRTLRQAADELGLSLGQVKSAYRAVINELRATYLKNAEHHQARLVLANRAAQSELWRRYEAVRDRGKTRRTGSMVGEAVSGEVSVEQSTAPDSEVKFLTAILKAQDQEAKLLHVYETEKAPPPGQGPTLNIERGIVVMNNAELGPSEWVRSLPRQFAAQGKGIIEGEGVTVEALPAPEPEEDSGVE